MSFFPSFKSSKQKNQQINTSLNETSNTNNSPHFFPSFTPSHSSVNTLSTFSPTEENCFFSSEDCSSSNENCFWLFVPTPVSSSSSLSAVKSAEEKAESTLSPHSLFVKDLDDDENFNGAEVVRPFSIEETTEDDSAEEKSVHSKTSNFLIESKLATSVLVANDIHSQPINLLKQRSPLNQASTATISDAGQQHSSSDTYSASEIKYLQQEQQQTEYSTEANQASSPSFLSSIFSSSLLSVVSQKGFRYKKESAVEYSDESILSCGSKTVKTTKYQKEKQQCEKISTSVESNKSSIKKVLISSPHTKTSEAASTIFIVPYQQPSLLSLKSGTRKIHQDSVPPSTASTAVHTANRNQQ